MTAALMIIALFGATPSVEPSVEEVEEVVDLDALGDEQEYAPPPPTLRQTIGRMHAALVHLPIGALLVVVFLELLATFRRRESLREAAWWVMAGTVAAFLPTVVTGLIQLSGMDGSPRLDPTVDHRNVMLGAFGLLVAATFTARRAVGVRLWIYRVLVFVATGLVTVGGHLGGKLVFGDHYLPF